MKIATGSTLNMTPAGHDWVVAFDLGDETGEVVCPVIGWATAVEAHLGDGTTTTCVEPAFVWGDMIWTPAGLREHTPGLGSVTIRRTWDAPPAPKAEAGLAADLGHATVAETAQYASSAAAPRSFEDIVDADAGLSPMYRAVVQVEQEDPNQFPVVIGVKAWALLDPEQQQESFKDLVQAYVDVVQHQRDGRPIR